MTEPTDAELKALWQLHAADIGGIFCYARAVLAKWGQPAQAAEPVAPDFFTVCALYEGGGEAGWLPLPGYSNETEHGVKNLVLEAARKEGYKGTATGRLLELGWEIRPVYLTQQPTQAQVGAVESAEFGRFLSDVLTAAGLVTHGKQCKALGERLADMCVKLRHHGIKGGQHGTDTRTN